MTKAPFNILFNLQLRKNVLNNVFKAQIAKKN